MTFRPVSTCRACGSSDLFDVVDLGRQPLANAYRQRRERDDEPRFPLAMLGCAQCGCVQLSGTVPPREMFDNYAYFSSYSSTMVAAMKELAHRVIDERRLGSDNLIVEVASNDGYLLRHYAERRVPVLGIEPAANVAESAIGAGIPTEVAYFGASLAQDLRLRGTVADVIHANNVIAHVPDINDFIDGLRILLADDGVAIIETPSLLRLVDDCLFDTIYHEHVFCWSLTALASVLRRHGLTVVDVEAIPVHGGSLRIRAAASGRPSPAVEQQLALEDGRGVRRPALYAGFARELAARQVAVVDFLEERRAAGRIAAYGAAAKATVVLNAFGIDRRLVDYVVDRNPAKQGLFMPGTDIPIVAAEQLLTDRPEFLLILVWNLVDEVLEQMAAYRSGGGRCLVALPHPREVEP